MEIIISVLITAFVSTVLLALLSHIHRRRLLSPSAPLPPSPPTRLPIIGHLHLISEMPHHSFTKLAKTHGPIIYLQLGQVPTIVISSSNLARQVLKLQDQNLSNRPQLISAQYLSFGCSDITFSRYGPYWRQARKICVTELLSPKRVASFHHIRTEETNRMLQSVSDRVGSPVDLSKLFFTLANDVLCRVAFGRRFIDDEDEKSSRLVDVLTETQALFAGFCLGDFFPKWGWVINPVTGYTRRLQKNLDDLKSVCDRIIKEHLEEEKTSSTATVGEKEEDFVHVLLRIQKSQDLEVPITDDNLKALVLDMFVAGTDTSSSTLEWTMTELARHPKFMIKAQEEVRQTADHLNIRTINETNLIDLKYTKAAIKEAMRLHPPVPLLVPRESISQCQLDGYNVPPETRVFVNTYAIGRDPNEWEDPLRYDPGRFLGSDYEMDYGQKGGDFKFLPFGGGRRGCPGYGFALATVEIALAKLLCHFDWGVPGAPAETIDVDDVFGLAMRKKNGLVLVPKLSKEYPFHGMEI